jgi:hypothetical protein
MVVLSPFLVPFPVRVVVGSCYLRIAARSRRLRCPAASDSQNHSVLLRMSPKQITAVLPQVLHRCSCSAPMTREERECWARKVKQAQGRRSMSCLPTSVVV